MNQRKTTTKQEKGIIITKNKQRLKKMSKQVKQIVFLEQPSESQQAQSSAWSRFDTSTTRFVWGRMAYLANLSFTGAAKKVAFLPREKQTTFWVKMHGKFEGAGLHTFSLPRVPPTLVSRCKQRIFDVSDVKFSRVVFPDLTICNCLANQHLRETTFRDKVKNKTNFFPPINRNGLSFYQVFLWRRIKVGILLLNVLVLVENRVSTQIHTHTEKQTNKTVVGCNFIT